MLHPEIVSQTRCHRPKAFVRDADSMLGLQVSDADVTRRPPALAEVVAVSSNELGALRNLFQFYEYDFSEIEGARVGDDGRFHQLEKAEFEQAYLFRVDRSLAGFALVNRKASRVMDGEIVWWMEEFFVMRHYRRASLGRRAAQTVIERHPGTWELTQTPNNHAAIAFWRAVLAGYAYDEIEIADPKWGRRPLQRFSIGVIGTRRA
jgi:predicted acetyltransferase